MTDVSGISQSSATDPSVNVALDGDTLMSYCAAQLNELNGDIDTKLANQQKMSDYKAKINDLSTEIGTGGKYTKQQVEEILTKFGELLQQTPSGSSDYQAVMNSLQSFRTQVCYKGDAQSVPNIDGYLDKNAPGAADGFGSGVAQDATQAATNNVATFDAKTITDGLSGVSDDVGKNAELDMISLQDLVSKRQMAIQTTSQIMAKFAQGYETIANNIK